MLLLQVALFRLPVKAVLKNAVLLLPSCGFMVKTKQYVYMLRCTPVKGDYQFYIYCYQRKPFEKAQKEQQKNDRLAVKKRAEPER